jgi:hypothetical protein
LRFCWTLALDDGNSDRPSAERWTACSISTARGARMIHPVLLARIDPLRSDW